MIINRDCLEALKDLESNSIDSLVTDPPAGISFMGKAWDDDKGGRDQWIAWLTEVMRECYRVLKPGAHGLVWAIPRTSHWTATALENAGFEVRDVITHHFGTGFPKSHDVSKAIDKAAGAEREKGAPKPYTDDRAIKGNKFSQGGYERIQCFETLPATDAARQWSGWGTALKPASEHWILIRKPLGEKTVAANVLKHGTGGINIDATRVGGPSPSIDRRKGKIPVGNFNGWDVPSRNGYDEQRPGEQLGRFPANLVLSHNEDCVELDTKAGVTAWQCSDSCAVAGLDRQSGVLKSRGKSSQRVDRAPFKSGKACLVDSFYANDTGGASRFFYVAKASKADRNAGLEVAGNGHPTVKSTALMRYLCRLVTPAGGTVLDPFAGSGSTGVAAISEGFSFIGIEMNAEYVSIAEARIEHALPV